MEGTNPLTLALMILYSDTDYVIDSSIGPFTIHTILSHLYCHYSSLVKAVGILSPSCTILNDDDTELYRRMCTTTLVASNKEDMFDLENDSVQVMSISHVISEVAEVSLKHFHVCSLN